MWTDRFHFGNPHLRGILRNSYTISRGRANAFEWIIGASDLYSSNAVKKPLISFQKLIILYDQFLMVVFLKCNLGYSKDPT
jgi:hypothetical protein